MLPAEVAISSAELARICGGRFLGRQREVHFRGACIDSRRVTPGCLFACLIGERVDGHDYAAAAVGDGAAVILASRPVDVPVGIIQCSDVTAALGRLAAWFRDRRDDCRWIGITGSNGKTTVKELMRAACASGDAVVHATSGNLNNQLGVPLSVLATPAATRYAIIEMGASAPGEIDGLAAIVRPDIGLITGIGPAHLEGFGGLDGVASGKGELLRHCRQAAVVSLCGIDRHCANHGVERERIVAIIRERAGDLPLTILDEDACATRMRDGDPPALLTADGDERALAMPGRHNAWNAILCLEGAALLGLDQTAALHAVAAQRPVPGRLRRIALGEHICFDDSYNANPASMAAGLAVLARQPGARLAVLGAMGELGSNSAGLHRQVGAEAARLGLPLLSIGDAATAIGAGYTAAGGRDHEHVDDCAAAAAFIRQRMAVGPLSILVKASRAAALDRVVDAITDHGGPV